MRFGPSSFLNFEAALFKLKQTGLLDAFMEEFEPSTRCPGLFQSNLLNFSFLASKKIYTIGKAKLVNDKIQAGKLFPTKPNPFKSHNPISTLPEKLHSILPKIPPNARCLTPAEMTVRREKGLHFNCDEKFVPGHKCKGRQFLCIIDDDVNECALDSPIFYSPATLESLVPIPEVVSLEAPAISFQAYVGQTVPVALRLRGVVYGEKVVILVDTCSTHNFIQTRVAKLLYLVISPSERLTVTVGNGETFGYAGVCRAVPLQLNDY
ncbi:hypothetical protein Syun_030903 [Stephania yunnanensis]|uniref:Uncharacterized protein n=1 Tax=Stephania yunnanensis TaxID=152371 RepID=A0AAP0DV59_9MAGN